MLDWISWALTEHGQPLLMTLIISMLVGWGFRLGWIICTRWFGTGEK
jgi:steroid 5-alpha reductase family enzyme